MAALDFLFQGAGPSESATAFSQNGLPEWYNQYTQGVAGLATQAAQNSTNAGVPQQSVAGFNQDQLNAFQGVRNSQGAYWPALNAAGDALRGTYNNALGTQQQVNSLGQGALAALTGPGAQAAANSVINAGNAGINAANSAASGAAGQANSAVAGNSKNWIDPGTQQKYMSPYTSAVVDEIGRLGNKNWNEQLAPGITSQALGMGDFGSTRNADVLARAGRDVQQNILGQQSSALESGYALAGNLFNQDANRHQQQQQLQANTALQGGQLTANTALQGGQLGLQAATNGNQLLLDALKSGNQLAINAALQGGQLAANTGLGAAGQALDLGKLTSGLALNDANALGAIGQAQQQLQQQGYNTAYDNALSANNWDWNTLNNLSSILRGAQLPTTSTKIGSNTATAQQQAPLSGLTLGLSGLLGR